MDAEIRNGKTSARQGAACGGMCRGTETTAGAVHSTGCREMGSAARGRPVQARLSSRFAICSTPRRLKATTPAQSRPHQSGQ